MSSGGPVDAVAMIEDDPGFRLIVVVVLEAGIWVGLNTIFPHGGEGQVLNVYPMSPKRLESLLGAGVARIVGRQAV